MLLLSPTWPGEEEKRVEEERRRRRERRRGRRGRKRTRWRLRRGKGQWTGRGGKKRTGGRKQRKMEMTKIRERGRECKGRGYRQEVKKWNPQTSSGLVPPSHLSFPPTTLLTSHQCAVARSLSVCRLHTGCRYKCEVATSWSIVTVYVTTHKAVDSRCPTTGLQWWTAQAHYLSMYLHTTLVCVLFHSATNSQVTDETSGVLLAEVCPMLM